METDIHQDLAFIKQAVEKNRPRMDSLAIWMLWAAVVGVGFALMDFAPQATAWYWLIAGPVAGIVTWLHGRAVFRARGERRAGGATMLLHWLAMGAAQSMLFALGTLKPDGEATASIVVVALAYFYYGLYRARPFIAFAILLLLGAVALRYIHDYAWTGLGALMAAAFLATAIIERRRVRESAHP
jgi:hypothetical protein